MLAGTHINDKTGETTDFSPEKKQTPLVTPSWRTDAKKSQTEDWTKDILLANNPRTTTFTLDILAETSPAVVLERIAENPNTSPFTLSKLAFHDNPRVRAAVTDNPNLPESIMWRLASDMHPDVRLRLAESYYAPSSILLFLADDDNPYVQNRAQRTLSRLNQPMLVSLAFGCC